MGLVLFLREMSLTGTPLAGHPGHSKTLELITCNYHWPRISQDVRSYVAGCNACQRTKP